MRADVTKIGDPLTDRQREVYDLIRSEIRRRGISPTVREIGKAMGIGHPNGVICHLKALERKGVIRHEAGLSRSITVIDEAPHPAALLLRDLAERASRVPDRRPDDPWPFAIRLSAEELATIRAHAAGEGS